MIRGSLLIALGVLAVVRVEPLRAEPVQLTLRSQTETSPGSGRYHRLHHPESWDPARTAIIVCDVWDLHHCLNAVRRLEEFGPRLNDVLANARERGITIIHAPSDCMPAYSSHPARHRAMETPAATHPPDIAAWCSKIPAEERAVYPIDQSDGGEDDDPAEHAKWAAHLESLGRNPGMPWARQSGMIAIDSDRDFISDRGDEVWNILEHKGIRHVILTGVHTNMCVLGRPFGLRQMARNGRQVVLMRDMTDTMYNPRRWPYVSHYTGTDLIISHVEQYVCPTITSDQFLGGAPFRFRNDHRPRLAIIMAEEGYQTSRTLPAFAASQLGQHFQVSCFYESETEPDTIPGLDELADADAVLISVRRKALPEESLRQIQTFVRSGKPVIGIRTASHAFALNSTPVPEGRSVWPEFDAEVFGGHYHGHYGDETRSQIRINAAADPHPVLAGLPSEPFAPGSHVYKVAPLARGTTVLLTADVQTDPPVSEPVAWTYQRADGGRSFYAALGHADDFDQPAFVRLLTSGIYWASGVVITEDRPKSTSRDAYGTHWSNMPVPSSWEAGSGGVLSDYDGVGWYRCVVRIPSAWLGEETLALQVSAGDDAVAVWFNGEPLSGDDGFEVPREHISIDDASLVVVRVADSGGDGGLVRSPALTAGSRRLELKGRWQFRTGDDPAWSNMPLPAKFGTSTDIVFEP